MKKIICISHYGDRESTTGSTRHTPEFSQDSRTAEPRQETRGRGVLLQFPSPFDGPLYAAAIAAIALLGALGSAVHL